MNKDTYKRITERRGSLVIDNCGNCPNVNNPQGCTVKKCYEIMQNRLAELEDKIEDGTLIELGYHIRKSYRNHDDQRYKIILIDEVNIDKIGYDCLTKSEAEAKLKELQEKEI